MRWSSLCLCVVLLLLRPGPARAGADSPAKESAEALYQDGARLYDQGQYDAAADKLRKSYDLDPAADKLPYLIRALCQARRGDDARRYLALAKQGGVDPSDLAEPEKCVAGLPPPPTPPRVESPVDPNGSAQERGGRPRWLISTTTTLAVAGAALVVTGLVLALNTWCTQQTSLGMHCLEVEDRSIPGWSLVGAGGAALVTGGITLGIGLRAHREDAAQAALLTLALRY